MQKGNNYSSAKEYPLWLFIVLPAITMLLGWGLRGFIGGGPFGAMIPGAMAMLTLCMLLNVPPAVAAVMVVFGTAGIGMGGEMTYGQTLGFLRNPDTVWWGTCGTTVKGGVWGLVGGVFIGLGLIHKEIKTKTIVTSCFKIDVCATCLVNCRCCYTKDVSVFSVSKSYRRFFLEIYYW